MDLMKMCYGALSVPKPEYIANLTQDTVLGLLSSPHFQRYPPSEAFQRTFWKTIIDDLESREEEVDERVYERYLDLLAAKQSSQLSRGPPPPTLATYFYDDGSRSVTLLESRTTIEAGTTGLRTWQAAFTLADYLLDHQASVQTRNVLELGSGTGFLGIVMAQIQLQGTLSGRLVLTDCNDVVMQRCRSNLALECNQVWPSESVYVEHLDWMDCEESADRRPDIERWLRNFDLDVVVGADLVFDPSTILPLVSTLKLTLKVPGNASNQPPSKALIALTVRRKATTDSFREQCDAKN